MKKLRSFIFIAVPIVILISKKACSIIKVFAIITINITIMTNNDNNNIIYDNDSNRK